MPHTSGYLINQKLRITLVTWISATDTLIAMAPLGAFYTSSAKQGFKPPLVFIDLKILNYKFSTANGIIWEFVDEDNVSSMFLELHEIPFEMN